MIGPLVAAAAESAKSDLSLLLPLVTTVVVAAAGCLAVNRLSANRAGEPRELDRALCDVALCGNPWQARVADQLRSQLAGGSALDGDALLELLANLRNSLRADLSLAPTHDPHR